MGILMCLTLLLTSVSCVNSSASQGGGQGTLNLADTGPVTLDPALAAESTSASYIVQIFSGLTRFDSNLQVIPDIAQNWDKSADGMTFTFHLRNGVKFQNGKAVTASDFKYSWERALNPDTGSLTAGTYLNDIVGASEMLSGHATQLNGVKIIDDYTLQVNITSPIPYFLDKMAYPTSFVVDKTNVESGSTWWQHPNGTGPFKLLLWQQDRRLVLGRNPTYYGGKAKLNQVSFQLYNGDPMQLYQAGTIDATYVSSAYIPLVTDPNNQYSKELSIYPELSFYYIEFNTSEPPFDDVNIRQAFSYAVDKEKVINLSTENVVTPAYGILPPDMPGYNSDLSGLHFDPDKAKSLIAASKYGSVANLPPIVFTTSGWGGNISGLLGGVIEEWRKNLGVEVTVRQIEPDNFSYYINQEKNSMFDTGWVADYPDPQDFLDILFHTGAQNNMGDYSNPVLDSLLEQASTAQDNSSRLQLYQQAEQTVIKDAAVLPLYFSKNYVLTKPNVKGYMVSPLGFVALSLVSVQ